MFKENTDTPLEYHLSIIEQLADPVTNDSFEICSIEHAERVAQALEIEHGDQALCDVFNGKYQSIEYVSQFHEMGAPTLAKLCANNSLG